MAADHPNKHIREAIEYAKDHGWRIAKAGGHAHIWGKLLCPFHDRKGCCFYIHSTPKNPQTHAKRIRKAVDNCEHGWQGQTQEDIRQ